MKKTIIVCLLALCCSLCLPCTTWAQNKVFEKYSEMENGNVEYICITRSMLKLMGAGSSISKKISVNGVNITGLSDAIKVLIIINSGDKKVCQQMAKDFKTLKADPNYELLMMVRDDFDKVSTLFNNTGKDKELVMYIDDSIDQTFIVLTGQLDEEMVNKLLSK
ncbi:MAG: DUF4252 domain-containing protein [Bacteroidales bacterium]|nr:DUF4252 domain-containing protein [Bacteroidales bacterium]